MYLKKINPCLIILFTAIAFNSCTANVRFASKADSLSKQRGYIVGDTLQGWCSYYGPNFNGRKTASGEIFNMHQLTAAHRNLPFGSILEVTNTQNGKKVRVRINDRGPFKKGRILDLSLAAAKKIDLTRAGTAFVKAVIIRIGTKDSKK